MDYYVHTTCEKIIGFIKGTRKTVIPWINSIRKISISFEMASRGRVFTPNVNVDQNTRLDHPMMGNQVYLLRTVFIVQPTERDTVFILVISVITRKQ